jgi:hypothetical protein
LMDTLQVIWIYLYTVQCLNQCFPAIHT